MSKKSRLKKARALSRRNWREDYAPGTDPASLRPIKISACRACGHIRIVNRETGFCGNEKCIIKRNEEDRKRLAAVADPSFGKREVDGD